jgi:phosphoribosylanthranilate isomerase
MSVFIRVKICGITNEADAQEAARLGADALGFNFYSGSPRFLTAADAAEIIRDLPPFVEPVAVFVEESFDFMTEHCRRLGPVRTFQYHGEKAPPPILKEYHFIPAFGVKDATSFKEIHRYLELCLESGTSPTAVLLDSSVPGKHGGTGKKAPWRLLHGFEAGLPIILAGGLTPENVTEAIRIVRPFTVDVASGVESSPGKKDPEKMRRFIAAVREASSKL